MALPAPAPGLVIAYSYLWFYEHNQGHEDGRKVRPAVILFATETDTDGDLGVYVSPITHATPPNPEVAVEIPPQVGKRLGLDDQKSWAILDEVNHFTWPGVELGQAPVNPPSVAYGFLPPALFAKIRTISARLARTGQANIVPRTE